MEWPIFKAPPGGGGVKFVYVFGFLGFLGIQHISVPQM